MNLRILSVETMIVLAKYWLTHPLAVAILAGHQVGQAISTQMQVVYDMLLVLNKRRNDARGEVAQLTRAMLALDKRHDDSARAVFHHLHALRAAASAPDEARFYDDLLGKCFPYGLSIVNHSYLDESGFAESLAEQMLPAWSASIWSRRTLPPVPRTRRSGRSPSAHTGSRPCWGWTLPASSWACPRASARRCLRRC